MKAAHSGRNLLVSSAGRKAPLIRVAREAIARATGGGVIAGDSDGRFELLSEADEFWLMPATRESEAEKIAEGCAKRDIGFVLPTRDGELEFWSAVRPYMASRGIHVIVSASAALRIALDKLRFYQEFPPDSNINVIQTELNYRKVTGEKLVVKERFGSGSTDIGIDLTHSQALSHAKFLKNPVFQPFVDAREISIDAYFTRHGAVHGLILRDRLVVVGGESKVSKSFRDEKLEHKLKDTLDPIGRSLGFFGPVVIQAFLPEESNPFLIEINARFGGASTLGQKLGIDSIFWALQELIHGPSSLKPFVRLDLDYQLTRTVCDVFL